MSNPPWTRKPFSILFQPLFWLSLILVILQASGIPVFAQATNFAIGTTVQQSAVKHFGINMGDQDYYDSGQMFRNLIFQNPGFEGEIWQSVLECVAVTATTCTDANPWNVWPANFLAGATFEVINGAALEETGTIISNTTSDYAAGNTTNPTYGLTFTFAAPSIPLAAGDYLIVRMTVPGNAQAGWWTSTSGGGTLLTDSTDIAPDSPGKQALEMQASGSGQSASVNQAFDTTTGRSFVQLNGTYTLNFKAKGLGGNNQLSVSVIRLATAHGNENFLIQNVNLTGSWQDYSYTFTAAEDGTYIGPVQVVFSVSGADAYLDDVSLMESPAANNPTVYRNAVVDTLQKLSPGVLRYNSYGEIGTTIANTLAVPFARQRAGHDSQTSVQPMVPMGLHDFLVLCQTMGAEPWYTVPMGITPTDMQNLIQYLGGASTTTYGAIRASLGQSDPWTSVFPVIHLELGNELWNSASTGEAIQNPVVYGNRTATIFAAARASSSYNPASFDLIMGSQAVNPWWTQQEMANSSGFDSVDAAPYLFYTLSDFSSNEAIFGPMFAQPEQIDEPSSPSGNTMAQQAQTAAAGSANLAVYEVNLSTDSGTAPQSVVNEVVGGVGAGITVADHMLLMLRDLGITTQNMFALPEYENGFNGTASGAATTMPLWGSVIDMGGETNLLRPTFLAEQLANSAILPTMLAITVTGANPTWNQPLSANDTVQPIQLATAHYLQAFAFTNGTQNNVIVFNLSRSGSLPVTFSGTNAPTGNVLVSQLTSANITDNNENNTPVVSTTQTNVSNFQPATSYSLPPFSMTVFSWPGTTLPPSTTTLTASPTQGTTGQTITLTANVTSQSGTTTPTGTVTFVNGSTTLGTATLNSTGTATFTTTSLPAGTDSITASYGGDTNDASSTSSPVTVSITSNTVATTTSLNASATQINTGQNITFTAAVTPASGSTVPTGLITFLNGTTTLGTATLNSSGVASFSTTTLPAGTDSITASYGGSTSNSGSVSAALTVQVTQTLVATTTTLTASATQLTPGQSVTFNAQVTPQSGNTVPTGVVTFLNGSVPLGTATLSSSGAASFSTASLATGTHSITASYGGSTGNSVSVSTAVQVTVATGVVATTTTLSASATQINPGDNVTFTARVSPQSGSTVPAGTVSFMNGPSILGTATLNSSGVATFSTSSLASGSYSITASYGGNTSDSSSVSSPVTVTVGQNAVATTTLLSASANQVTSGQSVTLTAKVSQQSGTAIPNGTVTFLDRSKTLGTATLDATGTASLSTVALIAGANSITASYAGNSSFTGSNSPRVMVSVTQGVVATTTTLAASPTQINTGQSVTFTAKVSQQSGSTVPTGSVTFQNGSAVLGEATLNASGVATFSTTGLAAGTQSIVATYGGSNSDSSSTSPAVAIKVTQTTVATTTELTASSTQPTSGQSVTFTVHVSPQSGDTIPSGTVTLLDGSSTVGTATLNSGATVSFSTASLAPGTHSITAVYGGNTVDVTSTSSPVTIMVATNAVATTASLTASATQITVGQSVTFTATVSPQSGKTVPAGTVTFLAGSTVLGTGTLNNIGVASLNVASLTAGTHSITASYGGNASDSSSVSSALTVTVNQAMAETTTKLSVSPTQIDAGQSVTFTATVSPQSGSTSPSGTVSFLDGSTTLGTATLNSSGVATFSTTSLAAGSQSITAFYNGSTGDSSSLSPAVVVTVTAAAPAPAAQAATTTTLTTSSAQVNAGQSVSFTATVKLQTGSGTPAGTVTFKDGQTVLGDSTLSGTGSASFSTASLAVGTYSITASYGGDSAAAASTSAAVTETVDSAAAPSYTMAVSSSNVSVTQGQVANLTVTLTPLNGFNMPVTLTCSGMPAGTSCSFNPPTVTPDGKPVSSTLSILAGTPSSTTSENREPGGPFHGRLALGLVMPWGLLSLLGLRRRGNRLHLVAWCARVAVTVALIAGSLWMSGCGYSVNASVFTMTVTSSGKNVPTQTSQIVVNITQ